MLFFSVFFTKTAAANTKTLTLRQDISTCYHLLFYDMNNRQRVAFLLVWGFLLFFIVQLFHSTKVKKSAWAWEEWSEETAETLKAEKSQETEEVDFITIYLHQTNPCLVNYAIIYPKITALGAYYPPIYRWSARAIWRLYSLFCNLRR